ncbi:type II toxin-antitoxin system RelE/ParE family toxin [Roseimicrobium sp. ORNL1]|uniref:type II toxin-antitoxin system RelE/ParE family toxin n=1 Tax=Roseimicrobium sp. ORNL1 TaxID=2711231 RepID=UPI0013E14596|nr:type II toxin-antitoxin system RelE/ParE family toxin [Roseimicrobium sp. ORNL1]QIF04872.1 type II toxin-antitoxin system RelE/ParE family toxin [Roseimicrobium sp. ORNL1]
MQLVLHPKVYSDIDKIMAHYERVAGSELADEFYEELRAFMVKAAGEPESYSLRIRDIRRVNLQKFPYNFLFRIVGDDIRILVVRHHRRRPNFGTRRR